MSGQGNPFYPARASAHLAEMARERTNPMLGNWRPQVVVDDLAAHYTPWDESTVVKDGSNRVALIADVSPNSAENGLVLDGNAGNYAESLQYVPAGLFRVEAKIGLDFTGTVASVFEGIGNNRSWFAAMEADRKIRFVYNTDGTGAGNNALYSTASVPSSRGYFSLEIDVGAGYCDFFSSADGLTWEALGVRVNFAPASLYVPVASLTVGATSPGSVSSALGVLYYARLYDNGALVRNFDATIQNKLETSWVASTGETWTVYTTGSTGARIAGARDLYQGTASAQPLWVAAAGSDPAHVAFDGLNHWMQAIAFPLTQPCTDYLLISQTTFTAGEFFKDGLTGLNAIAQYAVSPDIFLNAGGGSVISRSGLALNTWGVVYGLFNGDSSRLGVNLGGLGAMVGVGTDDAGGITVGARSNSLNRANFRYCEHAVYDAAQGGPVRVNNIRALAYRGGVAL